LTAVKNQFLLFGAREIVVAPSIASTPRATEATASTSTLAMDSRLAEDFSENFIINLHAGFIDKNKSLDVCFYRLNYLRVCASVPYGNRVAIKFEAQHDAYDFIFFLKLLADHRHYNVFPVFCCVSLWESDSDASSVFTLLVLPQWFDSFHKKVKNGANRHYRWPSEMALNLPEISNCCKFCDKLVISCVLLLSGVLLLLD
jgi:hypothetical protein